MQEWNLWSEYSRMGGCGREGGMNEKDFFQSPVCGRQAECRGQKTSEADERVCNYTVIRT